MTFTFDLSIGIIWTASLAVVGLLSAAIVQRVSRGIRAERDAAHKATEESQAAALDAMKEERETNVRRIAQLEADTTSFRARIVELETAIRVINENVTGRPAYAELAAFITRGLDIIEKSQHTHEERMIERHTALLAGIQQIAAARQRRPRVTP